MKNFNSTEALFDAYAAKHGIAYSSLNCRKVDSATFSCGTDLEGFAHLQIKPDGVNSISLNEKLSHLGERMKPVYGLLNVEWRELFQSLSNYDELRTTDKTVATMQKYADAVPAIAIRLAYYYIFNNEIDKSFELINKFKYFYSDDSAQCASEFYYRCEALRKYYFHYKDPESLVYVDKLIQFTAFDKLSQGIEVSIKADWFWDEERGNNS